MGAIRQSVKPETQGARYISPMMLYESLAPLYDELFPIDPLAPAFLASLARAGGDADGSPDGAARLRALDAGCATGGHALALAALGLSVVGIDSETAMIGLARKRALREGLAERASFLEADIGSVDALFGDGSFDLVLCLGNTLPHLDGHSASGEGAARFLAQARRLLVPGGALVLQMLNFSLPGLGPGFSFPPLSAGGAVMRRSYRPSPEGDPSILKFVVELSVDEEEWSSETRLLAIPPRRVRELIREAGFGTAALYSSWKGDSFEEDSDFFFIAVAVA